MNDLGWREESRDLILLGIWMEIMMMTRCQILPYDKSGHYHGTHVAGVVGAVADNYIGVSGINQNVKMMAAKGL